MIRSKNKSKKVKCELSNKSELLISKMSSLLHRELLKIENSLLKVKKVK